MVEFPSFEWQEMEEPPTVLPSAKCKGRVGICVIIILLSPCAGPDGVGAQPKH